MSAENYIPKEATQQIEFLKKYPKYDGRGVKIAIIDIDIVDKSLPGLQKTSTGLPKIIDCIGKPEITIDTSTVVKRNGKNFVIGLSGRKLKIPSKKNLKWKNPSDEWHLGSKPFEELCNNEMEPKCDGDPKSQEDPETNPLHNRIVDFIVWFDGEKWRACIDASSSKRFTNLEHMTVLTNFEDEHEISVLPNQMPYCVTINEEGNTLKILWPHDSHGTLVTHIAAAYFAGKPEQSGLAPGAQVISMHLIYWKNMEEAILKCIELEIDIINLSLHFQLTPEITETIKRMVDEHGVIVIQAAGNEGPFSSSILNQFSQISEHVFFIGAIFGADAKKKKFEFTENLNSVQSFSSIGPLPSGARGIDFVAPGNAVADLPKWYPTENEQCQGTSLAAPNVAGLIACLLSALKANKIPYSPGMIKLALANTAYLPEGADKLAFGNGIIQIKDAFEFIKKSINKLPTNCCVPISIDGQPEQRGILYIHNKNNTKNSLTTFLTSFIFSQNSSKNYCVKIDPKFNTKWILQCINSNDKNFVTYSDTVTSNSFTVKIDPSLLEEGSINYAEISGIDSSNPSIGPIFHLPITVISPADSFIDKEILLKPGPPTHFFFKIPPGSQACSIKITSLKGKAEIFLGYLQKRNSCWCGAHHNTKEYECLKFTAKKNVKTLEYDVEENENEIFEICFYHTNSTALNFKMDVTFQKNGR